MDSIKRALENIGRLWANLTATQRVILSAAAAATVLLLVWGSVGTGEAWVRVAGAEMDQATRYNVLRKLQERNQKHELRGTEILVPKEDADRVVLELAGEGAMSDDAIWKFLETSDPFVDPKQKEMRYKRALEQKLGLMIRRVEFVRNASVMVTYGSDSDKLGFVGHSAKASVQVELQEGRTLSPKNVAAIANLVAKSVKGLDADQVVITDNKLNSYSLPKQDSGSWQATFFRDYEKQIEDDIRSRIKEAFRTASVVVRITARNTQMKKESEKHTNPKVVEDEERKSTVKPAAPASRGLKGEDGAIPQQEPDRTEQENRTKYKLDHEKTVQDDPAGKIERITIGVLIPIEVGPDNKELVEAEKQLPKIEKWVLAAADAPEKSVSVQFIPSRRPEAVAAAAPSETAFAWIAGHATQIALAALAVFGLLVMARVVRGATAKDTVEELQALTAALTETQEASAQLATPAETDLGRLKQGLQDMVGKNPQTVAASLRSFMSGR